MSVLIDTSVWVDHFRNGNDALVDLIELDLALTHPMVIGEIACGTPPAPRIQALASIGLLQPCNQASLNEVMEFIEREKLYGLGCGLVDMSLLASTLITPGAELWTLDRRLADLAGRFGIAHRPTLH
ncbi:Ribonuclease VapC32 [Paraburkholderia aspalathi]|uniref:Ribonuclease VapC32 n=1 Tax=Paraburkholderia aspalathi TaxID=1324617 RepID=A0ABN7N9L6_9BURK|nr:PIN domain-containing protein [Paraburkholderia aspalathi]MBK3824394.1 VapC toxin family PIN domain ribonuclease [Paraburkholderia aspalathi]MBK3836254.1 VapC toxin family PIN domain ribonuclease [Paraburkholderia aspalathi]MBK3866015.1 VapC toxin family PIN domain ribonuclease [Paraburkholderia aspalathi]CAE6865742.1 Ribonuclease VapC32 [Paraburkholderia aspalathi]